MEMHTGTQTGMAHVTFTVDQVASRFTVQAFATGLLSAFGHNPRIEIRDYDAEIHCVAGTLDQASVRVTIRTSNLEVLEEMKRDDRRKLEQEMYEGVLDVKHFPTAVYEANDIRVQKATADLFRAEVNGELSFHGVTQRQPLQANVTVMDNTLRIAGEFSLQQSVYGIKPMSLAAGTLRLKDELKFRFDLVARQEDVRSS